MAICRSFVASSLASMGTAQKKTISPDELLAFVDIAVETFRARLGITRSPFPLEEFRELAELGVLQAPLAERDGGLDLATDSKQSSLLLELLMKVGQGNLSVGRILEGHVNALQLIYRHGSRAQITRAAHDVREHACIFGVWNTEPSDGVRLEKVGSPHKYRMIGRKTFASGAGYIQRAVVTGDLSGGWQMAIVPLDSSELIISRDAWQPIGMEASASYTVDFSQTELNPDALLGDSNDYYTEPFFSAGSVRFSAIQLGAAQALFDECRYFLTQQNRSDDPYHLLRISKIACAVESGRQWIFSAAKYLENDAVPNTKMITFAHLTRSAIEQICLDIIQLVEQSIGARGLLDPHPFGRILRDLQMYLRQAGHDAALTSVGRYVFSSGLPADKLWVN